ncbi:polyadenylate-binding protein RBP45-like [Heracleum sosnowskyi]|uniref:Polyadenylate-binding protein RBP45-like n=1 Tax=Heracleum sosnowskyi TaxID=360622 RepID=A0AAD8HEJ6_9APIA|nr:polyadenylate-binding protein RBP45-like [Heracleum sosnowskyi]
MQPAQAAPINPAQYQQQQQWYQQQQQQQQQSQYQQQPHAQVAQQQYAPPPQHYAPPQQQPVFYPAPQATVAAPQQAASGDEIRTLWIGDLQYFMDEDYLVACFSQSGEVVSAKVIRNKSSGQPEGYGFIEFASRAAAERNLQAFNGTPMPNVQQNFRLNWASFGVGEKRPDDMIDYTIFVGDLAADVSDYTLQETFRAYYPSVRGAKVVIDKETSRSKGYGFVKFGDENEQLRAMTEMNGIMCSSRPMRIGPAANKKSTGIQQPAKATYQNTQGAQSEDDPNNTTIFVGGLDPSVTEEYLRQVFGVHGQLEHVKIPLGKRCGFVQFAERARAEEALSRLNGSQLGGQNIRLSWGRTPSNKQPQVDPNQWNGGGAAAGYYGYGQGYETYGYAPPSQGPNLSYGGYPGYGNYPQNQQQQ